MLFLGEWHKIGKDGYAVVAVPERFPALLLTWVNGNGIIPGLVLTVISMWLLRRHRNGPWATVVLCDRAFRFARVVQRVSFADQRSADEHARHIDAELAAGRLPSPA